MAKYVVGRGTLINTAAVAAGAGIGLLAGKAIPGSYEKIVVGGIGLAVVGIGIKMFLESKNILALIAAIAFGGILGHLIGIQDGVRAFAEWAKTTFGAEGETTFVEAILTTSVLFCVGPLTLLGCIQDALEDKVDLIATKSMLDGIGSIFFAAALGVGVLVSAGVVFIVQGLLTILASPLKKLVHNEATIAEATAAGGLMMLAIGLTLLGVRETPVADYLPSLFLAPLFVSLSHRLSSLKDRGRGPGSERPPSGIA